MKSNMNWLYKYLFLPPYCTAVIPLGFFLPLAKNETPRVRKPLIWNDGGPVHYSIEAKIHNVKEVVSLA